MTHVYRLDCSDFDWHLYREVWHASCDSYRYSLLCFKAPRYYTRRLWIYLLISRKNGSRISRKGVRFFRISIKNIFGHLAWIIWKFITCTISSTWALDRNNWDNWVISISWYYSKSSLSNIRNGCTWPNLNIYTAKLRDSR